MEGDGIEVSSSTLVTADVTYYAHWAYVNGSTKIYKVKFDATGGRVSPSSRSVTEGMAIGTLPEPVRSGYTFTGWFTAANGGTKVTEATVVTGNVTYYAHWAQDGGGSGGGGGEDDGTIDPVPPGYEEIGPSDITEAFVVPKAVTIMGAAYDGGGAVVGIVELKLGKVNARKGTSKVSGAFNGLDGKNITMKAVNAEGIDGIAPATVSLDVKNLGTMTVTIGGTRFAGSLGGWHIQSADVGGNWTGSGATVTVDADDLSMFPGMVLSDLLPKDEQVAVNNGKWMFAKAAGVKWTKPKKGVEPPEIYDEQSGKGLVIDDTKGKTNFSSLKLTYTPKKGIFKGSFKVYALEGEGRSTRLKKYTVNVSGVVADGVGYGTATCKQPAASWLVTVR